MGFRVTCYTLVNVNRSGMPPMKGQSTPQTLSLTHCTQDEWEIPRSSIKLMKCLGEGHYGEVFIFILLVSTLTSEILLIPASHGPLFFKLPRLRYCLDPRDICR